MFGSKGVVPGFEVITAGDGVDMILSAGAAKDNGWLFPA